MRSISGQYKQKMISSLLLIILLLSWLPAVHAMDPGAHHQHTEASLTVPCEENQETQQESSIPELPSDDGCLGNACIQCTYCAGLITSLPSVPLLFAENPSVLFAGLKQGLLETLERPPKLLS